MTPITIIFELAQDGFTCLMLAANKEDSADTVAALLAAKADPNMKYYGVLWYFKLSVLTFLVLS